MSTSSTDSVFGLITQRIAVPVGATLAFLLDAGQTPGANSVILKYFSGGTLEIIGVTAGVTLTAAQLNTANGTGYLMGTTEVLQLDGPVRCYLSSTGATTLVHAIYGRSQGN